MLLLFAYSTSFPMIGHRLAAFAAFRVLCETVASLFAAFGLGTPAFCLCCFKTW
jgi:hypothetical protein